MRLASTLVLLFILVIQSSVLSQDCCTKEIQKLENKLARKYDSYKRIEALPKDGEVNSMSELFYLVVKQEKYGLINGNRALIYGRYWEGLEIIPKSDRKKKFTFFRYSIDGKSGIGSIQGALHLPAEYSNVEVQIVNDSNTICLLGSNNDISRIDWIHKGNDLWISKQVDFPIKHLDIYKRASHKRYGVYDDLLFVNGAERARSYEVRTGNDAVSGPIGYYSTVQLDDRDHASLLCIDHTSGNYLLMDPNSDGALTTLFTYNEPIVIGHVIEEGLIIAKTPNHNYKIPLSKFSQDFQLKSYDDLYHSDQNLFLVQNKRLVVVNRQGSKQISIRHYYEPDLCGNYHPEIHLTEEEVTSFGHLTRSLEGSIFVTREGQILNDSLYLMEIIDKKNCLYLFYEDEYRDGILGVAAPKNKRGLMGPEGSVLLPPEYSAIWKKGDYYLTMKGGSISEILMMPTRYYDGEWILYNSDFEPIGKPVSNAEYRIGGVIEKNGFTIDDELYSTFDFTKKFFGIGVYEP
ncbi:MAG: hypothetical protein ACI865_000447 [Flavobacteriaceae bacterium]|jgi:hypothetical protein